MKVVNVDSINYHLIDGGYYADKDDIDELDSIEMYTKDEVIAMLTELQTEFEEGKYNIGNFHYDKLQIASGFNSGIADCIESIQEKINRLKGNENGNNN